MTSEEFLAAGGVIEKLDDTKRIKHIDLHTFNRAQFGNLPPKTVRVPPREGKKRPHRMRLSRGES